MQPLYSKADEGRQRPAQTAEDLAPEEYRSPWRRDFARLIHCPAFRRLNGKTQLFPGVDSDFFRNRLTHSLEVAQIAKSIAIKINHEVPYFCSNPISTDIVEIASLAHDIGHPPFGHNGEKALDDNMKQYGGFEGNAQTLRILSRLEKKETLKYKAKEPIVVSDVGRDLRIGLNLTFRVLASVLKYDSPIPVKRGTGTGEIRKGYYHSERELVSTIRRAVAPTLRSSARLRTIECDIMDLADDIAYSTYDLEDAMKAEFVSPMGMISYKPEILQRVAEKVEDRIRSHPIMSRRMRGRFLPRDVLNVFLEIFGRIFERPEVHSDGKYIMNPESLEIRSLISSKAHKQSLSLSSDGYFRTSLTSRLVGEFIRACKVKVDSKNPQLSRVYLEPDMFAKVEVLKNYTYESIIMSPRLKVVEFRGYDIVSQIFKALDSKKGLDLLPEDFQAVHQKLKTKAAKKRVICDFIAGMTDRYAAEFYGRLFSADSAQSMFKPF